MAEKALIKETFFCHFYLFRQIQDLLSAKFQFDTDLNHANLLFCQAKQSVFFCISFDSLFAVRTN